MAEIISQNLLLGLTVLGALFAFQFIVAIYMAICLRASAKERTSLNKEMFGLVKRIEALTSNRREQMLKHYDRILSNLATRLPSTIAAQASQRIFETESKILARLAELEPNLKQDDQSRRKMDELIRSMENLEQTIVALTAEAVRKVMVDSRSDLLDDEKFSDISIAA